MKQIQIMMVQMTVWRFPVKVIPLLQKVFITIQMLMYRRVN